MSSAGARGSPMRKNVVMRLTFVIFHAFCVRPYGSRESTQHLIENWRPIFMWQVHHPWQIIQELYSTCFLMLLPLPLFLSLSLSCTPTNTCTHKKGTHRYMQKKVIEIHCINFCLYITNDHKLSSTNQCKFPFLQCLSQVNWVFCSRLKSRCQLSQESHLRLGFLFQAYGDHWQHSVPGSVRTGVCLSCWLLVGLLTLSFTAHPQVPTTWPFDTMEAYSFKASGRIFLQFAVTKCDVTKCIEGDIPSQSQFSTTLKGR